MLRSEKRSKPLRIIEKKQKNMINTLLVLQKRYPHWTYTNRNFKFMFQFHQDPRNKLKALTTGKRQREIGIVVPAKLIFITNNKRFSEVLENDLVKRKNKFPTLTLKFQKKGVYRKSPFLHKTRKNQLIIVLFLFNRSTTFRILEAYYDLFRINALLEAWRLLEGVSNRGGRLLEKSQKGIYSKYYGNLSRKQFLSLRWVGFYHGFFLFVVLKYFHMFMGISNPSSDKFHFAFKFIRFHSYKSLT